MRAIRNLVDRMSKIEEELLSQRDTNFAHDRVLMLASLLGTLVLAASVFTTLFLSIRQEMNARSQMEQQLRASEENLSVTLNSIGDAVIATDIEGCVTRMNAIAEQLTGWPLKKAMGRPIEDVFKIINHKTRQPAVIPVMETLTLGVTHGLANDTTLIASDGSECAIADSCAPIRNRDGFVIGAILVFRDVTAEYTANAALQQAKDAAELANQAKDSFLATMSHEIRTPLSGLLGMLELLELTTLTNDQTSMLQAARDSGIGLLRILNDILDWSKIEEGKLELSLHPASIAKLLDEVINTYSHVASSKRLVLRQKLDAQLSSAHIVDSFRLSQVLNNFVSNAIKFTDAGEVEISAELIENFENAQQIRFAVRDTGIGLSQEEQARLFKFQVHHRSDYSRLMLEISQGNTGQIAHMAHRLKGSSRMVGAKELATIYTLIEQLARQDDLLNIKAEIPVLEAAVKRFDEFLLTIEVLQESG